MGFQTEHLEEKIQQLEQRLKEAEIKYDRLFANYGRLDDINIELDYRIREAENVLKFYGDKNNWSYQQIIDDVSDVNGSLEAGKRARAYIEKYKKEE